MQVQRSPPKTHIGTVDLESYSEKPQRYRLVIDFDSNGYWQLRKSLGSFPRDTLVNILSDLRKIIKNKK